MVHAVQLKELLQDAQLVILKEHEMQLLPPGDT